MHRPNRSTFVASLLTLIASLIVGPNSPALSETPSDWNQWRGPNRSGEIVGTAWGDRLDGHLDPVWSVPLGPSYSGPIVCGDLVFTTETIDRDRERVTAVDLESGTVRWTAEWSGYMSVPFFAAANGDWIRSTPACDAENLIVLGMRDRLVNLDPETGDVRWAVDIPSRLDAGLQPFGAVCSPLIDGDALFVQTGGGLCKVRLADGEVLWRVLESEDDMMSAGAFSSPVIATLSGRRQLVVQTRSELCGVGLDDGVVLWREPIEAFRGMNILTPLIVGDHVFTAAHSGKSVMVAPESPSDPGVRPETDWTVRRVWEQKTQGYMSSPVLIDGYIYIHLKNQRFACLEADTGEVQWTSEPFGKYWSMAYSGDKVLALDSDGTLRLIRADPTSLDVVDQTRVADDAWAHLAVAGDRLIVRDLDALKAFRWDPSSTR